jgi:hypothetical protein
MSYLSGGVLCGFVLMARLMITLMVPTYPEGWLSNGVAGPAPAAPRPADAARPAAVWRKGATQAEMGRVVMIGLSETLCWGLGWSWWWRW